MGAYNILFHFHKLYERLGPSRRKFDTDREMTQAPPTALFLVSTLGLVWMGIVLGYITLHEMSPGHRGSALYFNFYIGHLAIGCLIPVVFAFLVNADLWWSRWLFLLFIPVFFGFYTYKAFVQEWPEVYTWLVGVGAFLAGVILESYLLFNNTVRNYFSYLKRLSQ